MRLLTEKEVRERLKVSRSTFLTMRQNGIFPEGKLMVPGNRMTKRWLESDVDAWIKERMGA